YARTVQHRDELERNRQTDGRFGTKQHAEMEKFLTPAPAESEGVTVADPASRDDARLFVATRDIRTELDDNDIVDGYCPARRRADGNVEVDVEAGRYPGAPLWVASVGDIDPLLEEHDDALLFNV